MDSKSGNTLTVRPTEGESGSGDGTGVYGVYGISSGGVGVVQGSFIILRHRFFLCDFGSFHPGWLSYTGDDPFIRIFISHYISLGFVCFFPVILFAESIPW